ncbi:MAG: FkbM family methyltransferase [Candidatus Sungiibacteriota bacterium]
MAINTTNIIRRALLKTRRACGLTNVTAYFDGIGYRLDLNEYIDSEIYLNGYFEKDTTNALLKLAEAGMTIFDIGANSGAHTMRMAKLVGETGKVVAFEPMPWAYKKLGANIELNKFSNITVEKLGLSDRPARDVEVEIASSWPVSGYDSSQLHPVHKGRVVKEHIDFSTLDEYARAYEIKRLDIIKIDTDGYELKVLRGGADTLKRFSPILIVEMSRPELKEKGSTLEELISFLDGLGYQFYSGYDLNRLDKQVVLTAPPRKNNRSANIVASVRDIRA